MVRKRAKKKEKGKKGSQVGHEAAKHGVAGLKKSMSDISEPSSSNSSDNESEYEEEEFSLGSAGKAKCQKQKGKRDCVDTHPSEIDLTGLPSSSAKISQTHNLQSSSVAPEKKEKRIRIKMQRILFCMI